MAKRNSQERFLDFGVRGQFGKPWEYGQKISGVVHFGMEEIIWRGASGPNDKRWGVYQKRTRHGKIQFVRMNFMQPANPQTAPQQAWRLVFANGMSAWGGLTTEQKLSYHKRASKLGLYGSNLFMKEYLNSN